MYCSVWWKFSSRWVIVVMMGLIWDLGLEVGSRYSVDDYYYCGFLTCKNMLYDVGSLFGSRLQLVGYKYLPRFQSMQR